MVPRTLPMPLAVAAQIAGVLPDSLRMQIKKGRLKGEKLGRDWFVTRQELDRYLADRAPQGRPPNSGKKRGKK